MTTPRLALDELSANQAQPHLTVNESLRRLDAMVCLRVLTVGTLGSPPGSPAEGDAHIVKNGSPVASGAWLGQDGKIAYYTGTGWEFVTPREGFLAWHYVGTTSPLTRNLYVYSGTSWQILASL